MLATAFAVAVLFSRRVVDPLLGLTAAIRALAHGGRDTATPSRRRGDEIGEIAGALDILRLNAISTADEFAGRSQDLTNRIASFPGGVRAA